VYIRQQSKQASLLFYQAAASLLNAAWPRDICKAYVRRTSDCATIDLTVTRADLRRFGYRGEHNAQDAFASLRALNVRMERASGAYSLGTYVLTVSTFPFCSAHTKLSPLVQIRYRDET
jgi:hypothetical protein